MGDDKLNEAKKGTLLLFLSEHKFKNRESDEEPLEEIYHYFSDNPDDDPRGRQTNDAPVKCLYLLAKKAGIDIDEVLCITSNKVYTERITAGRYKGKTQFEVFKELVMEVMNHDNVFPIPYDYELTGSEDIKLLEDKSTIPERIYNEIIKKLGLDLHAEKSTDKKYIYVDYTGGLRDISFLMISIIRYLEFRGIECKEIVYSKNGKGDETANRIYNIKYIYDMYQIINGVNEFITTGNATSLKHSFKNETQERTKEVVNCIIRFANGMSLCDIYEIDGARVALSDSLAALENQEKAHDSQDELSQIHEDMIRSLIPLIRKKMFLDDANNSRSYIKMIEWCSDNRMIQRAFTLYVEKMPKVYREIGLLDGIVDYSKVTNTENVEETAFYRCLFKKVLKGEYDALLEDIYKFWRDKKDRITPSSKIELIRYIKKVPIKSSVLDQVKQKIINIVEQANSSGEIENKTLTIYGEQIDGISLHDFLKHAKERMKFNHFFLFDDFEKWEYEESTYQGYHEKILAVKKLYDEPETVTDIDTERIPVIREAMAYYLAIKIVRNIISHASENEHLEAEKNTIIDLSNYIDCLKAVREIDDVRDLDYSDIKCLIDSGIKSIMDRSNDLSREI